MTNQLVQALQGVFMLLKLKKAKEKGSDEGDQGDMTTNRSPC